MTDITIKEHRAYWTVLNGNSTIKEYRKDDIADLTAFASFLIDELYKANAKQSCWFEKYWEVKKQLNQITDVLDKKGDIE